MSAEPSERHGALIAVDWGTTHVRAMLLAAGGAVIEERHSDEGIGTLDGGHEAAFARLVAGWPHVPAIMAGMVGSRQGWREAPYVPCPATPASLGAAMLRFETGDGRPVAIVPGVMLRSAARDGDVLRGEETQIAGLIGAEPDFSGVMVHPGTHSKWATIAGGAVTEFQTYMTGEMFDLLAHRSFLRHSVAAGEGDLAARPDFERAVRRTAEAGLPFLAAIFSVRARQLLDGVDPTDNLAYLSGLVIGGEIAAARDAGRLVAGQRLVVIGGQALAHAYARAFAVLGRPCETRDGGETVIAGLTHLARVIGFLRQEPATP